MLWLGRFGNWKSFSHPKQQLFMWRESQSITKKSPGTRFCLIFQNENISGRLSVTIHVLLTRSVLWQIVSQVEDAPSWNEWHSTAIMPLAAFIVSLAWKIWEWSVLWRGVVVRQRPGGVNPPFWTLMAEIEWQRVNIRMRCSGLICL